MRAPTVPKLGFAMQEDLRRVEAALPGATEGAEALFDLQDGATRALGFPKRKVVGLAAACESLLSMLVDKTEQTSDWSARPLTASQLAYAATDASVLIPLASALGRDSWTSLLLSSGSQAAQQPRRPPLSDEEREKRKVSIRLTLTLIIAITLTLILTLTITLTLTLTLTLTITRLRWVATS